MINLYGKLGRQFERIYKYPSKNIDIKASSAFDALRMLEANFRGFKRLLKRSGYYRITNGSTLTHGKFINQAEVGMGQESRDWHFMGIAYGCGGGGGAGSWIPIVIGVALIAAAYYFTGPAGGTAVTTTEAQGGMVVGGSYAISAGTASLMYSYGVAFLLYGLNNLFFGAQVPKNKAGFSDDRKSFLFGGPVNTVEPGSTISVIYGHTWAGSIVASGGLETKDYTPV